MLEVPNDGFLDFYSVAEYSPHGYVWMIPKEGGRANVGLVTTDKKGAVKYLENFIQDTYLSDNPKTNPPWRAEGIKTRPFGGTIPISGPRSQTVDEGLILVGTQQDLLLRYSKEAVTWRFGLEEKLHR